MYVEGILQWRNVGRYLGRYLNRFGVLSKEFPQHPTYNGNSSLPHYPKMSAVACTVHSVLPWTASQLGVRGCLHWALYFAVETQTAAPAHLSI